MSFQALAELPANRLTNLLKSGYAGSTLNPVIVTFGKPFLTNPFVVATIISDDADTSYTISIFDVSLTSFTFVVYNSATSAVVGGIQINYIAIAE